MSNILIASWDGGGNTPSAYNLAARLIGRGHRVRMLGWTAMAPRAAAAGIEFRTYPTVPPWPDGLAHEDGWALLCECLFGPACRADVVAEGRDFGADVLVVDCMLAAGVAAAVDLGVPCAALVHVSYREFVHEWGDEVMGTSVLALLDNCDVVLALQPPGYDDPCDLPPGHEYVGAISHPAPVADGEVLAALRAPGTPWVLATLSTTDQAGQRAAMQGILDALADQPVRVLATLAGAVGAADLDAPGNATLYGFVEHQTLLPHLAAVVTHGGMSTVTAALAAGIPMVCIPQGRDQAGNAERVAKLGAGLVADLDDLAPAVEAVLSDPAYRVAAGRLASASAALGGGARATDLVEALARPGGRRS